MFEFIAHRGYTQGNCENSVAAIRGAHAKHINYVELDVRINGDGSFVIMHDETVDRTTDGTGPIHTMSDAQVRALNTNCTNGYVPFLARALDVIKAECSGMGVFLDIKHDPANRWNLAKAEEMAGVITRRGLGPRTVLFIATEPRAQLFQQAMPNTKMVFIGWQGRPCVQFASQFWGVTVNADQVDQQYVEDLYCNNTRVIARNTALQEDWAWVRSCGGWGAMTDDINSAVAWRD